ncbi:NAD-dependent DNA ligase LigA [Streptomyces olivoreticuli]
MTITADAPLTGHDEYLAAIATARGASAAYYSGEQSPLDDASYDRLLRSIADYEQAHPQDTAPDSPTGKVAGGAAPAGDIAHTTRMLSLDNAFTPEELVEWGASLERRLGQPPVGWYAVEAKLDGAAVAARYRDGRLVQLITRGDSRYGEDVSHVIGTITGLPEQLADNATVEVRGEVLLTAEQFEAANVIRVEHGDKEFSNPRNGTSGTLRAKDRAYRLPMTFWAYGAVELDGESFPPTGASHTEVLKQVAAWGVQTTAQTPMGLRLCATLGEVQQQVDQIAAMRDALPFGIDGVVVKANDAGDQAAAGAGSRFPHWAIAFKLPAVERQTKLLGVEWNVGRTGVLAPRAVLEPVEVDGSVVTYATLHNPADILRRELRLGDTVIVYKAGDIIPRIEAPLVELRTGDEQAIAFPEACPNCGGEIDKSQERWRCAQGAACRLPAAILYAAGRDQLDIDGLGPEYVSALVSSGDVADVADLFTLDHAQLAAASGSTKRADRLSEQIEQAKRQPLHRVFCALGVLGTGRTMSRRIAAHFGTMDAIRAADAAALTQVDGIGPEKAPIIASQVAELGPVIDKLTAAGVNMSEPRESDEGAGAGPLAGKTVVVTGGMTGALEAFKRHDMEELIRRAGGEPSGSVSKKTSLVVAGEKAGSKKAKAESLGIEVLTPEVFAELVADYLG